LRAGAAARRGEFASGDDIHARAEPSQVFRTAWLNWLSPNSKSDAAGRKSCIEHFVMAGKRCRRIAIKGRANRRREFGEIDILGMHDAVFYREVMHERSKQGSSTNGFGARLGLLRSGLSRRRRAAGTAASRNRDEKPRPAILFRANAASSGSTAAPAQAGAKQPSARAKTIRARSPALIFHASLHDKKRRHACEDVISPNSRRRLARLLLLSTATLSRHYEVFDAAFAGLPHLICYSVKPIPTRLF